MNKFNSSNSHSTLRLLAEKKLRKNNQNNKINPVSKVLKINSSPEAFTLLHELQVHQIELDLQNQELEEYRSKLEAALEHYTDLYDFALNGYFTFDNQGIIVQTNLMGAKFLERERSQVIGKLFASFIVPENVSIFNNLLKKVFTTQKPQSEVISLMSKNFQNKILQIDATIDKQEKNCWAVIQDITERIKVEELIRKHQNELTQVARAKSMGELASAISHEINQPLAVIANYVNGCIRRLESKEYNKVEILEIMRSVVKQVKLCGDIIHHMKNIMRQDEASFKLVSINEIAKASASQIQKEMQYNVSIPLEIDLTEDLPLINANYIQIELVILNLLRNSFEALSKTTIDRPMIILRTECQENYVIVSVSNNGPHFTADEEKKLFDPCFTTKENGTGMGLSISRTIVEAHFGRLTSHKLPHKGVCFQFSLPIARAQQKQYRIKEHAEYH